MNFKLKLGDVQPKPKMSAPESIKKDGDQRYMSMFREHRKAHLLISSSKSVVILSLEAYLLSKLLEVL